MKNPFKSIPTVTNEVRTGEYFVTFHFAAHKELSHEELCEIETILKDWTDKKAYEKINFEVQILVKVQTKIN